MHHMLSIPSVWKASCAFSPFFLFCNCDLCLCTISIFPGFFIPRLFEQGTFFYSMLALLADGKNETFGKLITKFKLEKPGKWHLSLNPATIKTWKLMKNDLEKPGVKPSQESGYPVFYGFDRRFSVIADYNYSSSDLHIFLKLSGFENPK